MAQAGSLSADRRETPHRSGSLQKAGTGVTDLFIARFAADEPIVAVRGDLNGNGKIETGDAVRLLRAVVGLEKL